MDCELLARYRVDHDGRVFEKLVAKYRPLVCATARRILHEPHDVDDAVQETFIRLSTKADTIHGSLPGWLVATARSVSVDLIRAAAAERRRRGVSQQVTGARDPLNHPLAQQQLREQFEAAIEHLDGPDRELLHRRFFGGEPLRQIAGDAGVQVSAVSRRISRAVGHLQTVLQEMDCRVPVDLLRDPALTSSESGPDTLRFAADWRGAAGLAQRETTACAPGWSRPIRVGVFVGYLTSRVISPQGYRLRIEAQTKMTTLMVEPAFELVGVVEPDTSQLGSVERTLREHEITAGLVNGTDLDELCSLDVLFLGPNFGMANGVLETLLKAVESGVGLLNEWWVSFSHSTLTTDSLRVRSILARPPVHQWHTVQWHDQPMPATVLREHPAIPSLCVGQRLTFNTCGPAYLPADGAEILAVKDYHVRPEEHGQPHVGALPMPGIVVGHIGKGRVLATNFSQMGYITGNPAIRHRFVPDALQWLAAPRRDA